MADSVVALLRDPDPSRRKAGITQLARSRDPRAHAVLDHLRQHDADPAVRELAGRAIAYLDSQAAPAPENAAPASLADLPEKKPSVVQPPSVKQRRSGYALNLVIFALVCVVGAAAVIYAVAGDLLQQVLYEQALNGRIAEADTFPFGGPPEDQTLDGRLFAGRVNNRSGYYIQEPSGTAPAGGWPLIVAVHGSNSSGRDALGWLGRQAADYGAVLIAPSFPITDSGGFRYTSAAEDLNLLLAEVERYYPINGRARMLFGFSGGGMFASSYAADYYYFTGVSIGASREFDMPPANTGAQFIVICGEEDERLAAATQFVMAMNMRGTPVWYYEAVPDLGHSIAPVHIDKTFELLDHLRGL